MEKIGKTAVVGTAAEAAGVSKEVTGKVFDAVFKAIGDELVKGNKVIINGFGTFERRARAARTGRNPSTGAEIQIPAQFSAALKQSQALKTALNG